jgi:CheY-like chemotaxis protein
MDSTLGNDGTKREMLIVDDDPVLSWSLGKAFSRHGWRVTHSADGNDALALLKEKDFDAVLANAQLPGLGGLELVDWVRANRNQVRIVLMTNYGGPMVREAALRHGASLFLEKPVDVDFLVNVLDAERRADSFSGSIDEIDLFDWIQLMLMTNRQAVIDVTSSTGEKGRIWIDHGHIPHAICGALEAEQAFLSCLGFDGGSFSSLPWQPPTSQTIEDPGNHLLMEAARIRDEARRSGTRLPTTHPPAGEDLAAWDSTFAMGGTK